MKRRPIQKIRFHPCGLSGGTHPEKENNSRNYKSAGLNYFTTSDFATLPYGPDLYAFIVHGSASVFDSASFFAGFDYYFAPSSDRPGNFNRFNQNWP